MRFPARREPWLIPVLAFEALITLGIAVWLCFEADARGSVPLAIISLTLFASLPFAAWLVFGIGYEIDDASLILSTGPFHRRIPLRQIDEVFPAGAPLSPAWAINRLQVMYRAGDQVRMAYVSPADRTGFLQRLTEGDPALRLEGERVQRRFA